MKNLLKALHAAVASMGDPKKNAKNDHFRNRYADLTEVLACIEEPLRDNGLVLTQTIDHSEAGLPQLTTSLWHVESGEVMESDAPLILDKQTPQAMGSSITYMRRYAIKALFGLSDVDDDAEGAMGRPAPKRQEPAPKPPRGRQSTIEPFADPGEAADAIASCKTPQGLTEVVAPRIRVSTFSDEELAELRKAMAKRMVDLKGGDL